MIRNMDEYCKNLGSNNIVITYNGLLWSEIIEELASTLQTRMAFDELRTSVSRAIFSVFVEQTNNMLMYSAEKGQLEKADGSHVDVPKGTFILGIDGKLYFIQTGNIMKNESIEMVKSRIDFLNTLDKVGLRKYYNEQIELDDTNPESKGAGLGLIEVARRANTPIEYAFTPYDERRSFFTMYVTIGGGN